MTKENLQKIIVDLGPTEWHGYLTETVWAEYVSSNLYRVRNVPFYAKGLSVEDIVAVESKEGSNYLRFVSKRAGHSTYRIFLVADITVDAFKKNSHSLEDIGCTYEKGEGRLFAIDVPPNADIYKVYSLLEEGEKDGVWEFEEGYCGHPVNS